jgi:hypothetical protein
MDTRKQSSTSEMQVTSIRLEAELKERLRELSGEQGYQALIREILWRFVEQRIIPPEVQSPSHPPLLSKSDIRATFNVIAQQEEYCVITGQLIQPQQHMRLGLSIPGKLVPLSTYRVKKILFWSQVLARVVPFRKGQRKYCLLAQLRVVVARCSGE